jgi:hypothetical protein
MLKNKNAQIIAVFCVIKLSLHLVADFNSGYQGDELLHIQTGNHLAMGYMEFPPVIGLFAFIQNLFHSSSVIVNHIFVHIASLLIMILLALTTIELGGKTKALFLVLFCVIAAPALGRTQQLFQPVVFSQLFWVLSFYQLVRLNKTLDKKYLLYLTLSIAFGFLTKYDMLFFIAGLTGLLFFARTRTFIFSTAIWKYILLFLILIAPNIYWQIQHQFPVLQMFSRLYEMQLNKLSGLNILKDLLISLNPFTIIFWIGGIIFMFNKKDVILFRPLAISILLSVLFLAVSKSKPYYFFPVILILFVFGSIWFEQNILTKRKWIIYPVSILLLASGLIMLPFSLSILPLPSFIKLAHIKNKEGWHKFDVQEYYGQSKWKKTLTAIKKVYDSLPVTEQQNCLIWGKHYSQSGGVDLYGADYGLPKAFSYHGSFYLWAPDGPMPEVVIGFTNGEATIDFFKQYFNTVIPAANVNNPYANFEKDEWQTVYICKEPKQDFAQMKILFKNRVFE